ncbi:MAG: hypothetical protein WBW92_05735 [Rhodanobacteraceae bacterium]
MHSFEQIRSHIGGRFRLRTNDPYLISFDLPVGDGGRIQGLYLAELETNDERKVLRISTPIAPLDEADSIRSLRFNWTQRSGFLAVGELDGTDYLHLCENRPYAFLDRAELDRLIDQLGPLADQLARIISQSDKDLT